MSILLKIYQLDIPAEDKIKLLKHAGYALNQQAGAPIVNDIVADLIDLIRRNDDEEHKKKI